MENFNFEPEDFYINGIPESEYTEDEYEEELQYEEITEALLNNFATAIYDNSCCPFCIKEILEKFRDNILVIEEAYND